MQKTTMQGGQLPPNPQAAGQQIMRTSSTDKTGAPVPINTFNQLVWKGNFITLKEGNQETFCSAYGYVALHPNAPPEAKDRVQSMFPPLTSGDSPPMEIKKFEDASKLPDWQGLCLCFTEQPGPDGAPNDKFRKLHLSLTKHNKFAYVIANTQGAPRIFALTPDGNPKNANSTDWKLFGIIVQVHFLASSALRSLMLFSTIRGVKLSLQQPGQPQTHQQPPQGQQAMAQAQRQYPGGAAGNPGVMPAHMQGRQPVQQGRPGSVPMAPGVAQHQPYMNMPGRGGAQRPKGR
ncbi:hypothetical protein GUITHDRAFT_120769 [Guillardia theta CCMP2712]|uniref:Mediator of RNA polymerase II transcription subunit 25 n=1 Tax=Guillardia theta (strain CCMP2712) TaxID=905079 RepID=L1IA97_GUITC|nr:hypothetical protein GUITHDRAFT_120769 [Guillardia theta CCMP2712]EKX33032.1 hypothetical protein GUITHDRAFT_120769 [Guillardia theta CCMP2712]|eukprot:XP_005820012.1 hypothetical protein GUITHDRAFT_120769 [Guillardia theta CCMP2712]